MVGRKEGRVENGGTFHSRVPIPRDKTKGHIGFFKFVTIRVSSYLQKTDVKYVGTSSFTIEVKLQPL